MLRVNQLIGFGARGAGLQQGPFRYWRINISTLGSGNLASVAELQMYESKFGQNCCTGGTAAADSIFDANYPASEGFDDGLQDEVDATTDTSVWSSTDTALPHWLSYDFGVVKEIVAIGHHGRAGSRLFHNPTAYTVEYSNDNNSWSVAWSINTTWPDAFDFKRFVNPSYAVPSYTGSPHGSHSFWRVFVTFGVGDSVGIAEMEYRATPSGADQATGGSAAASSIFSGSFPASAAFDDDSGTYWVTSVDWAWLRYDFASPVSVAEVSIQARPSGSPVSGPVYFAIQWADSSSGPWTTAWHEMGETGWALGETRVFTDPNYI